MITYGILLRGVAWGETLQEIDGVHSVEHLLCQLRGLHAAHTRILRFDDQISAELDSLREELQRKRQARAAFNAAHALFLKQMELITKLVFYFLFYRWFVYR